MNIFGWINLAYRVIVLYMIVFLAWNLFELHDIREQIMSVLVLIPLVLRTVGIK